MFPGLLAKQGDFLLVCPALCKQPKGHGSPLPTLSLSKQPGGVSEKVLPGNFIMSAEIIGTFFRQDGSCTELGDVGRALPWALASWMLTAATQRLSPSGVVQVSILMCWDMNSKHLAPRAKSPS